jgi:hypothetical protein
MLGIDYFELRKALTACEADLHPDTAPEAIRRAQLADVLLYLHDHPGAGSVEVGDALDLPTWSVECRLAEHRGQPVPYRPMPANRVKACRVYREGA